MKFKADNRILILLSAFFMLICQFGQGQEQWSLNPDRPVEQEPRHMLSVDLLSPAFTSFGFSFERKSFNRMIGWNFPVRVYWFNRRIIQQGAAGGTLGLFPKFYLTKIFTYRPYLGPEFDFGIFQGGVNYFSIIPRFGFLVSPHPNWEFSIDGGVGYELLFGGFNNVSDVTWGVSVNASYRFGK